MKRYNRYNFFKHTFCEFKEVRAEQVPAGLASYKSESGSTYYFDDHGVYRYSNHWGRAANCRWRLLCIEGKANGYRWGYALWRDFFPNNESDHLFYIEIDFESKEINYQHKYKLADGADKKTIFRTATATSKRIKQLKEVLLSDDWAKHLDIVDIFSTRKRIIVEMINTDKSLIQIKRELSNE